MVMHGAQGRPETDESRSLGLVSTFQGKLSRSFPSNARTVVVGVRFIDILTLIVSHDKAAAE